MPITSPLYHINSYDIPHFLTATAGNATSHEFWAAVVPRLLSRSAYISHPLWKQSAFTVWWPSSLASTKEHPIQNPWFGIWSYLIYSGRGEKCCPWVLNIWKPGFRIAPEGVLRPNGRQQAATLPWHFRDLERASGMIGMWKQVGIIPREHVFFPTLKGLNSCEPSKLEDI